MNLSNSKILLIIIASTAILIGNAYAAVTPFTDDVTISPGKLGIGTTSPTAPLHVSAGSLATGSDVVTFDKTRSASNAVRAATFFDVGGLPSDGNGGAYWRGYHLLAPTISVSSSNVFPRLVTYSEYNSLTDPASRLWIIDASNAQTSPHDIVYRIEGRTILYLDDSGKVGFGTTSPVEKIDIAGNIRLTGNIVSPNDICIGTCP